MYILYKIIFCAFTFFAYRYVFTVLQAIFPRRSGCRPGNRYDVISQASNIPPPPFPSVVDQNTLNLDPDPEFWPNLELDPEPGFLYQF